MEKISGKNILKQLTVCAVILLLTVVIELLFFNGHAVFRGRYSHDYFAENNGESFIERKETEEEIIFSLQVCEEYVDKIYLLYSSGMDFHYEIVLVTKDREQSEECIEDQAFSMFGQAVSKSLSIAVFIFCAISGLCYFVHEGMAVRTFGSCFFWGGNVYG